MRYCIILLMLLITAGCRKKDTGNGWDSVEKNKTVEIEVAYYAQGKAAEEMQKISTLFMEKNPHIQVNTTQSNWKGHYEKISAELAAGDAPDVFLLDSVFIPLYRDKGILEELTERASFLDEEKFPALKQLKIPDNRLYAIPQGIQVDVLYYNKDMFDAAGVDYPTDQWTLNDLAEAAVKLTNDEHFGFAIPPNNMRYGWYPLIRQFGGDILDESRKNSRIKSDPQVKKALEFMYRAWNTDRYVPGFEEMEGSLGMKSSTFFPREKVAMFYDSYVGVARLLDTGINYDVVIQPRMLNRYAAFIANCWVLNSSVSQEQKEAGWKFIEFYLSDEAQELHASMASSLPANREIMRKMLSDRSSAPQNKMAFLKTFEFASPMAENSVWTEQNKIVQGYLHSYFKQEISLEEFLEKAHEEHQALLDSYYK